MVKKKRASPSLTHYRAPAPPRRYRSGAVRSDLNNAVRVKVHFQCVGRCARHQPMRDSGEKRAKNVSKLLRDGGWGYPGRVSSSRSRADCPGGAGGGGGTGTLPDSSEEIILRPGCGGAELVQALPDHEFQLHGREVLGAAPQENGHWSQIGRSRQTGRLDSPTQHVTSQYVRRTG